LKVGLYEESSAMPAETYEHLRRLIDLEGYTLTHLLEMGIESARDRARRSSDYDRSDV
jgi:hypothetical protein